MPKYQLKRLGISLRREKIGIDELNNTVIESIKLKIIGSYHI